MYNKTIREEHVFISCPGDVNDERTIVEHVCKHLNRGELAKKGIELVPHHWQKDVIPQITGDRPQTVINDQMAGYELDIYIGILWTRFGDKQTANGLTPTEEEFELALKNYRERQKPFIQFYFKQDPFWPKDAYDWSQMGEVLRFTERVKKESGIVCTFVGHQQFRNMVTENIRKIAEQSASLTGEVVGSPKIQYAAVESYLPRRICSTEDYAAHRHPYLMDEYTRDTLAVVSDCKRVALIGDAGMGKTIELRRIASYYSQHDAPSHPFLVLLNKYVNQSIADLLPSGWDAVPESKCLIILDGLDEVEAKNKNDAIRQIERFAEQYPDVHMIVSCRTNFYDGETEQFPATLSGFSSYVLLALDQREINEYLGKTLNGQAEDFTTAISQNRLHDLLGIPFYLVRLAGLFQKNHRLPSHKAEIFQQLLEDRITLDVRHFRTTQSLRSKRTAIIGSLERIALGTEILGRNYITDDEYRRLVEDGSLRELVEHCTVWKKDESQDGKWQFEHNNFQEYLAARWLSDKPLSTVKEFMFFGPDYHKLIPSWSNTLSFLISIAENRPLIQWVMDNEPELCIKFEPDRIETSIRTEILKSIFNRYKQKRVWINHEKFRCDELARFGQSDETVEFILLEAEQADHYTTAANALELLAHLDIPPDKKGRASDVLVNYATRNDLGEQVQNRALMALADLGLNDSPEVIDKIVQAVKSTDNDWLRYGLYYCLHNGDYLDDNIDVFLDGLQHIKIDTSSASGRLINELIELRRGIEKAMSSTALMKILKHFAQHPEDLRSVHAESSLAIIAENTANAFSGDASLLAAAKDLFEALINAHLRKEAEQWAVVFDRTGTRLHLFKEYLSQGDTGQCAWVLAIVADKVCVGFFVEQYTEGKLPDAAVQRFRNYLAAGNSKLCSFFNDLINQKTGNKFPLPPERDYAKEKQARAQHDLSLLFDKEAFLAQIRRVFDTEHKETFTSHELINLESSQWDNPSFSDLAIDELRDLSKEKPITLAEAVEAVNKWNWDWFCIRHVYDRFDRRDDITLTQQQRTWVAHWCDTHLKDVDFRKALVTRPHGESSTSLTAVLLWHFLRKFTLSYPKDVLLDLISYDWLDAGQPGGIEYLEARLPKAEMRARILENLRAGIENDMVMKNHLDYCKRHAAAEVLPFASNVLVNSQWEHTLKRLALDTICTLSPTSISDLEGLLPRIQDDFIWVVIETLVRANSQACHKSLLAKLQGASEAEKIKAARYLIQLQDVEGLRYYVEWVKENKKSPEPTFHDTSCLAYLRGPEAVPHLIELLRASYQVDTTQNPFDSLFTNALDALTNIGLTSDPNYLRVRTTVEKFIDDNAGKIKNVNFLYIFVEKLDQRYYMAKAEGASIDNAVTKLGACEAGTP